jgi:ATP-dependent Zn protease
MKQTYWRRMYELRRREACLDAPSNQQTLDDRIVAHHESGHVLAAHALQQPISTVELTPTGGEFKSVAPTEWESVPENRARFREAVLQSLGPQHIEEMRPTIISLLSGLAAQRRLVGHDLDEYASHDVELARSTAHAVAPGAERELLAHAMEQAEQIVDRHWHAIEALASELLVHRKLDAAQIAAIIAPAKPAPKPAPPREFYLERRNGRDMPVERPTPGRGAHDVHHRVDGYTA